MYTLNAQELRTAARAQGFSGLGPVLRKLGLHRNTLNRFLKGAPVLPSSIDKLLSELNISPARAFIKKEPSSEESLPVTPLVKKIHSLFPLISIFLFGSRSRGTARKYSDFDIGLYSEAGLSLDDYLKIVALKEEFEEDSIYFVDCVNLNDADKSFLQNISTDLQLLAGYQSDLLKLRSMTR